MAKQKATISLDREKADEAQRLSGAATTSATVDLALAMLIRAERLRRDIETYRSCPPTDDELAVALVPVDYSDLEDDTDWAALYAVDE